MQGNTRKSSVRVLAGKLARREIQFYEIEGLRPTSSRIRETLFNWLTPAVAGARCLDLFAGSGALGFEAISRGATELVFVEKHKKMAMLINANINKFGVANANVHNISYERFLADNAQSFDIIFVDPPYQLRLLSTLLPQLIKLSPQFIYIEDNQPLDAELIKSWTQDSYQLHRLKKAGQVSYALLKRVD